jgi:hypothetical protein
MIEVTNNQRRDEKIDQEGCILGRLSWDFLSLYSPI